MSFVTGDPGAPEWGGFPGSGGGGSPGGGGTASPYPVDFRPARTSNLPFALQRRLSGFSLNATPQSQGSTIPQFGPGGSLAPIGATDSNPYAVPGVRNLLDWRGMAARSRAMPFHSATGEANDSYDHIGALLRSQALSDYPAETAQYTTAADLESGGDPYVKAYGALSGRMKAGSDLSRNLQSGQLSTLMAKQQWLNQLRMLQLEQAFQERMLRQYGNQGSGLGSTLLGGIGAIAGGPLGGAIGGLFGHAPGGSGGGFKYDDPNQPWLGGTG